jgi:hypothetical protein
MNITFKVQVLKPGAFKLRVDCVQPVQPHLAAAGTAAAPSPPGVVEQVEFENPNFETKFSLHRFEG